MNETQEKATQFGYKKVDFSTKTKLVNDVFDSVARRYDVMNDLMSFGMHRLWKEHVIGLANLKPNHKILDLAGGTADLSINISKKLTQNINSSGLLMLADLNLSMMQFGQKKALDSGVININFFNAKGEELPFKDNSLDRVFISFGLRNFTHKDAALADIYRVLKPGGMLLVLEFSEVKQDLIKKLYDLYSFKILPKMGEIVAKDKESYQYLAESIRMHPNQEQLKAMILDAGFDKCDVQNILFGVVAIHKAIKY